MRFKDCIRNNRTYIIAEMSANHGGSLKKAMDIVHAAAKAGADCLKIQTYTADTITIDCDNDYFKLTTGLWKGYTRYDLYKQAYTPWEWQKQIKAECEKLGMDFLSTVFDDTSVDFLEELEVSAYKIASFELVDIPLIRKVASTGKTIFISCGMGTEVEIEEAVQTIEEQGNHDYVLLKCTSEYPAVYEDMRISLIPVMKEKFGCIVGLSDHSLGYEADIMAVTLGAKVIEKHFCISRDDDSVDAAFSTNREEFAELVEKVRLTEKMLGEPVFKLTPKEKGGRINRKSIFVVKDVKAGEIITSEHIKCIRPGHGLHTRYYDIVLGKKASRDLHRGEPLKEDDYC